METRPPPPPAKPLPPEALILPLPFLFFKRELDKMKNFITGLKFVFQQEYLVEYDPKAYNIA